MAKSADSADAAIQAQAARGATGVQAEFQEIADFAKSAIVEGMHRLSQSPRIHVVILLPRACWFGYRVARPFQKLTTGAVHECRDEVANV